MRATTASLLVLAAACASKQPGAVLAPQAMIGPAAGPPGRVLVLTASCGSLEAQCRDSWAPAVDAIVTGSLDFHGYNTIDPAALRKDERTRHETEEQVGQALGGGVYAGEQRGPGDRVHEDRRRDVGDGAAGVGDDPAQPVAHPVRVRPEAVGRGAAQPGAGA